MQVGVGGTALATGYRYDAAGNRLKEVSQQADGSNLTTAYNYDLDERLTSSTNSSSAADSRLAITIPKNPKPTVCGITS